MRLRALSTSALAALALVLSTAAMPVHADDRDDRRSSGYDRDRDGRDDRYQNDRYDRDRDGRDDRYQNDRRNDRYRNDRYRTTRYRSDRYRTRTVVQAPRVVFRSEPRWRMVPGTRVYVVNRAYTNAGYDVFRYGNTYYLYNDGYWFAAPTWRGPFYVIDDGDVPVVFHRVPRDEWRSYPRGWLNVNVRSY